MKKWYIYTLTLFITVIMFCGSAASCQSGTTLSASVTANAHYQKEYKWTIDKTATPETFNLNDTETGTSQYTVSVTKDAGTKTAWIEGYVTVTNGGAVSTEGLSIEVKLTKPPSKTVIASTYVDTNSHPVLAPGETHAYHYRIKIPVSDIISGSNYKVTSDVTITNHSGNLGTQFGPSPCSTTSLPEPVLINDVVHVTDSNGESWTFDNSGSKTYYRTFSYKGNSTDIYENTATIQETGQSSSATVTINWTDPPINVLIEDPPSDPPVDDPLSDPPNDLPVDDPIITIGDNASVLSPKQSQYQGPIQVQIQNSININNNILTNNNINIAFSVSSANNTSNITNNNTYDPAIAVSNLNSIGSISVLAANLNKQIQIIKHVKIVKKHRLKRHKKHRRR